MGATTALKLTDVRSTFSVTTECMTQLDRVTVIGALLVHGNSVHVDRSSFFDSGGTGGISLFQGTTATVTNSELGLFELAGSGTYTVTFAFNTIYGRSGFRDNGYTITGSLDVHANIIARTGTGNAFTCAACTATNNIMHPQSGTSTPPNNGNSDPLLVDPANGDFHLQSMSPALDGATDTSNDHDFEGTARPQGAASDIGAIEQRP